jgi:glycosyltransferase involved in cell wall biosynthesis
VVANRGVLPEIVLNGQTGIVVNDTPENLAAALLKMGSSAEQRRVWGQAARNRMKEFFSLERQTRDIIDIYKRLVRQKDT